MPLDFRYYLIIFLIVFLLLGLFIIFLATLYSKKQQKNKNERIQMKSQFQQTLLQSQLEIQEQTFKNISQEIHDNIGQALTLAKLNLNTMPAVTDQQQEKIITTKEIISKAIVDLRDLSKSFNTDYIADMGLQKAMEYELGLVGRSSSLTTDLQVIGDPFRLDKKKELILFRIVQEVLNNIIKHAEARSIMVAICYSQDELSFTVADDGKGFIIPDPQREAQPAPGIGLRNMISRAKLIGADLILNSTPGSGTEVKIILPSHQPPTDS